MEDYSSAPICSWRSTATETACGRKAVDYRKHVRASLPLSEKNHIYICIYIYTYLYLYKNIVNSMLYGVPTARPLLDFTRFSWFVVVSFNCRRSVYGVRMESSILTWRVKSIRTKRKARESRNCSRAQPYLRAQPDSQAMGNSNTKKLSNAIWTDVSKRVTWFLLLLFYQIWYIGLDPNNLMSVLRWLCGFVYALLLFKFCSAEMYV